MLKIMTKRDHEKIFFAGLKIFNYFLVYRIINAAGGQSVYESEEEFLFNQKMYDELQDIMELVGFTQEVNTSLYSKVPPFYTRYHGAPRLHSLK